MRGLTREYTFPSTTLIDEDGVGLRAPFLGERTGGRKITDIGAQAEENSESSIIIWSEV